MVRPAISVVIPTRNRMAGGLLQRSVKSVLSQKVEGGFELIVVDDGSTDGTNDWLLTVPEVTTIRGAARGAAAARNAGAAIATGRILTFLDSDDEGQLGWLARHVEAMEHGEIACCGYRLCGSSGDVLKTVRPQYLAKPDHAVRGLFTKAGVFALERDLFWAVGGYAEELRSGQHTELSFRLLDRVHASKVAARNDADVTVNLHHGHRIREDHAAVAAGSSYVLDHHSARLLHAPGRFSRYSAVAAVNLARTGRRKDAIQALKKSLLREPWFLKNWPRLVRLALKR